MNGVDAEEYLLYSYAVVINAFDKVVIRRKGVMSKSNII
jgi:hypothetical protein